MRAIVVATGHCPGMQDLAYHEPAVLLPVAGKPFLHYVVESLVDAGITQIDFMLSEMPETVEESLGDGARWGGKFAYHLVRNPERPYGRLAVLGIGRDEPILLAHGDRLPLWNIDPSGGRPGLVFRDGEWTGWGILPGSCLFGATEDTDENAFASTASTSKGAPPVQTELLLSVRTPEEFLATNWAMIEKRFPKLIIGAREADDGIWISRNVSLHPTAVLTAPVYIGENCRINPGVKMGPRVVVSPNCLVDESSLLTETVVFPGSYIGQALELNDAIVNRNRLVNVGVGAAITVTDNFILGNFAENKLGQLAKAAVSRITAILLLLILSPVLLLVWLWRVLAGPKPVFTRKSAVQLPTAEGAEFSSYRLLTFCSSPERHAHASGPHEFFSHFLPGLIGVAGGHLSFVGVAPRTADEIEQLPRDWKRLYLGSLAGLITESYVVHGPSPSEDALYSAEIFYTATAGPKHDLALIAGYLARILGFKRSGPAIEAAPELEE